MRNKYFNADFKHGLELISDLERFCIKWQLKDFCKKNGLMKLYRKIYKKNPDTLIQLLEENHSFILKDANPKGHEGFKKGRIYYSWKGQIHYTKKPIMKFLIRLFFKQIYFY